MCARSSVVCSQLRPAGSIEAHFLLMVGAHNGAAFRYGPSDPTLEKRDETDFVDCRGGERPAPCRR